MVSNVEATETELKSLPDAPAGLSRNALTLAQGLDDDRASLAMKIMAVRELTMIMDRIRALAPPAAREDFVDRISDEVANRRSKAKTRRSA